MRCWNGLSNEADLRDLGACLVRAGVACEALADATSLDHDAERELRDRVERELYEIEIMTTLLHDRIDVQTLELQGGPFAGYTLPGLLTGDDSARGYLRYLAYYSSPYKLREAAKAARNGASPDEIRAYLNGGSDA